MDLFFSLYIGGVIVGVMNIEKEKNLSVNDLFSLLSWPAYAIIVLVQMVSRNSGVIFKKASYVWNGLTSVWNGLTIVWDWVVTRFKKK